MPTNLPRPHVKPKPSLLMHVMNSFMVVSVLLLGAAVLIREHGYVNGEPGMFADTLTQLTQQSPAEDAYGRPLIPPSN